MSRSKLTLACLAALILASVTKGEASIIFTLSAACSWMAAVLTKD